MNPKDVAAAKRLIAQFEDKAVGRHNSNMQSRPTSQLPRQVRERDEEDRHRGRMTIEEQELAYEHQRLICELRHKLCTFENLSFYQEVTKQLEELYRIQVLIIRSKRILSILKCGLNNVYGKIQVIDEYGPNFRDDHYYPISTTTYDNRQLVEMLVKLEKELSKNLPRY